MALGPKVIMACLFEWVIVRAGGVGGRPAAFR
jgi:hypothetical protein